MASNLSNAAPKKEVDDKPTTYRCKVYHLDMDAENKDTIPISVCVNDANNLKVFKPGEEVELRPEEIAALRSAVIETRILIPMDSAIYASSDPAAEVKKHYPGHNVERDRRTGALYAVRNQPRFLVEILPWDRLQKQ